VGEREDLARLQAVLGEALMAADPEAVLHRATDLPPSLSAALAGIDRGGLRIASLLVAQLRFQRLLHGSKRAGAWWQRDDRGFTQAFKRYHHEVPPAGSDPWTEAEQFELWCVERAAGDMC
jgi:hypothetical protein